MLEHPVWGSMEGRVEMVTGTKLQGYGLWPGAAWLSWSSPRAWYAKIHLRPSSFQHGWPIPASCQLGRSFLDPTHVSHQSERPWMKEDVPSEVRGLGSGLSICVTQEVLPFLNPFPSCSTYLARHGGDTEWLTVDLIRFPLVCSGWVLPSSLLSSMWLNSKFCPAKAWDRGGSLILPITWL